MTQGRPGRPGPGDDVLLRDGQQGVQLGQVAEHPLGPQLVDHRVEERLLAMGAVQVAVGQAIALAHERQRLGGIQVLESSGEIGAGVDVGPDA